MSKQSTHRAVTGMSRRNALITGAGAVAGSAAAVVGTRLALDGGADMAAATPPPTNPDVPVMLRLADARKGAFDVYVGTDVVHVVDNGFAARVTRAVHHTAGRSHR